VPWVDSDRDFLEEAVGTAQIWLRKRVRRVEYGSLSFAKENWGVVGVLEH
jgi:hypothetical protein